MYKSFEHLIDELKTVMQLSGIQTIEDETIQAVTIHMIQVSQLIHMISKLYWVVKNKTLHLKWRFWVMVVNMKESLKSELNEYKKNFNNI